MGALVHVFQMQMRTELESCLPSAGLRSSSLQEIQHKQLSKRIWMWRGFFFH